MRNWLRSCVIPFRRYSRQKCKAIRQFVTELNRHTVTSSFADLEGAEPDPVPFGRWADRSTVKNARQNTLNDCHRWLSRNFKVHWIRFRPGLRPGPHWGSLQRSPKPLSWFKWTLLLRGRGRGSERRRDAPLSKFLDPPFELNLAAWRFDCVTNWPSECSVTYRQCKINTRSSATAEGPRDASCQLKSCQLPRNSAETTYTKSPDQIDGMKLEI